MKARPAWWFRQPSAASAAGAAIKAIQANTKTTENLTAAFRGLTDSITRSNA